jgi:hypothetical protein
MDIKNSMNTGEDSLSHVHEFHKLMNERDIMLAYCGEFSQELNKTLLSFTERKFKSENVEDATRRKIFNIMVEMLQNISKNKIEKEDPSQWVESVFIMGTTENEYVLISSNMIRNDKVLLLKSRLEQVNSLDKEGLKQLYKDVRLSASFSENSGAGIGIIDIARKSENKLGFQFEKLGNDFSVFSLLIKINKEIN